MLFNCYLFWKQTLYPWFIHFAYHNHIFQSKKVKFDEENILHLYSNKSMSLDEMEYMRTEKEEYDKYYNSIMGEDNIIDEVPKKRTSSNDYSWYEPENKKNIQFTFNLFNPVFHPIKKHRSMPINIDYCNYCANRIETQLHMYNDNAYCSSECRTYKINKEKKEKSISSIF